jgi:hypothetical protein
MRKGFLVDEKIFKVVAYKHVMPVCIVNATATLLNGLVSPMCKQKRRQLALLDGKAPVLVQHLQLLEGIEDSG